MRAIYATFFLESFVLGNWIPRIPDVKTQFGMSASLLGVSLFLLAVGTLLAFLVGGTMMRRFGLGTMCRVGLSFWALGIALVPLMPGFVLLVPLLLATGVAIGFCEVAMNTAADLFERKHQRRVMSKAHGCWSVGSLVGAVVGAGADQMGVPIHFHFGMVAAITILLALLILNAIANQKRAASEAATTKFFQLPPKSMALLCIMPVGIMLIEGAFIDWSALFVETVLSGSAIAVGAIYAAFSLIMAVTRLSGDVLLESFGPLKVARVSAVCAIVGIVGFSMAPNVVIAFLAAALCGVGVAIFYPLTMTAAARRPGDAADNVAAMSLFAFVSFMLGPPVLGFIADLAGLRYALLLLTPLAILSLTLTNELRTNQHEA